MLAQPPRPPVKNQVEAAYRTGLRDQRRAVMEDWAQYLTTPSTTRGVTVP